MKALAKYLNRYAEPEVAHLAKYFQPSRKYSHLLCIPAFNESPAFIKSLIGEVRLSGPLLIILVINTPEQCAETARKNTNALLLSLSTNHPQTWQDQQQKFSLHNHHANTEIDLLLIDRCSSGREIPNQEGVGLARKIGCDIACWLVQQDMASGPWIHTSDADAILPADYFTHDLEKQNSALIYPYRHLASDSKEIEISLPMALYELSLHYYVAGLSWAGSPYAYHTLGSVIAVDYLCYAQARGFPKKNAAEDFYLLNKLNKIKPCRSLDVPTVKLSQRASDRVPFGTGPAVTSIDAMPDPLAEYLFYDPNTFQRLQLWLSKFPAIWQAKKPILSGVFDQTMLELLDSDTLLIDALNSMKVSKAIIHALQHSDNQTAFCRHLHGWFDAFRTLKLIHYVRDNALPSRPYAARVTNANFILNNQRLNAWQRESINHLRSEIELAAASSSV